MIEQRIRAMVGAYSVPAVVHAVQGDTGRVFVFELEDYTITGAEGASLNCQRPDKSFYTYAGTVSAEDNTVTVPLDVEGGALTQEGVVTFQLELTEAGLIVCTFSGSIIVEPVVGGEATQEEKDFRDAIQAQLNNKASNAQLAQLKSDLTNSIDAVADDLAQEILDRTAADATKANKSTTINGKSLEADRVIYAQDIPSKNLLPNTASTTTTNGVTFTVNADGSVTVNGTASADATLILYTLSNDEKAAVNGCVLSGCPSGGSISKYFLMVQQSAEPRQVYATDTGNGATITNSSQGSYGAYVYIRVCSGQTVSNLTFRPMIRLASITDAEYVPYAKTNVELTKLTQYDARYDSTAFTGYTKLPDGTLLEWGLSGAYASGNNKTMTVNLLVPFINSNYTVITTGTYGGTDSYNYEVITTVRRISESQFEIHCRNLSASYTYAVQWMAIGRWK